MARGTLFGVGDPNVFKVNVRFTIGTNQCQTGFKLRDLAIQDNTPDTVATTVDTWVQNAFLPLLTNIDFLVALDVVQLGSENGVERLYNNVPGPQNPNPQAFLPSFMCANVAMKTSLRKRYGQGRMFWPIRTDTYVDGDALSVTGINAFNGVVTALTDAFSGSVLTHDLVLVNTHGVLAARAAHGTTPARPQIPASWYDVETVKLNRTVTSLRSRKLGIGA